MPTGEGVERWVLVVTSWNEMAVAQLDWEQGRSPDFWHVRGDYRLEPSSVTHWMRLPEKPEA
jgi:hypothetical protein